VLSKEYNAKEEKIRKLMADIGIDFVLLSRRDNFAWLTCGGLNHVSMFTEYGRASILLGREEGRFVITDNIEAPRLNEERIGELGFEVKEFSWFEPLSRNELIKKIVGEGKIQSDMVGDAFDPLPSDFWKIRYPMGPDEIDRYRRVGYDASEALLEAARSTGPGLKEYEIEALVAASCARRNLRPSVILVAAEDRIDKYRHPLPKKNSFETRVMISLCAERSGLFVSLTRFIYRNRIPRTLDRRHEAVAQIDSELIAASNPGKTFDQICRHIADAYDTAGFKDEWRKFHQGGTIGYSEREAIAIPGSGDVIAADQALAWNPSLPGVKSEDTILVTAKGVEILTRGDGWEYLSYDTDNGKVERPWPIVI